MNLNKKVLLLVITHSIAPVNLQSVPTKTYVYIRPWGVLTLNLPYFITSVICKEMIINNKTVVQCSLHIHCLQTSWRHYYHWGSRRDVRIFIFFVFVTLLAGSIREDPKFKQGSGLKQK